MRTCNAESQKMSAKGSSTSYYSMTGHHRISIARKEKAGSRLVFSLIGLRDARRKYIQCREPKTGSKRFNSIVKTINIVNLGTIYAGHLILFPCSVIRTEHNCGSHKFLFILELTIIKLRI